MIMLDHSILRGILLIGNSFSFVGSLFIIIAYLWFKPLRSFTFKLVFHMSIADFLHSISLMLPPQSIWCELQAFLLQASAISSILWSSVIAYTLYDAVILEKNTTSNNQVKIYLLAYIFPFLIAFIPAALQAYQYASGWCWIKSDFTITLVLRFSIFYAILWTVMLFNVLIYIKIIKKIYLDYKDILEYRSQNRILMRRLSMYPIILVIMYIPISIVRISEIFNGQPMPFWLICVAAAGISLTGFANAIVYGFTGPVKNALRTLCSNEERFLSAYSLHTIQTEDDDAFSIL